jgi:hypothetical protein
VPRFGVQQFQPGILVPQLLCFFLDLLCFVLDLPGFFLDLLHSRVDLLHPPFALLPELLVVGIPTPIQHR